MDDDVTLSDMANSAIEGTDSGGNESDGKHKKAAEV